MNLPDLKPRQFDFSSPIVKISTKLDISAEESGVDDTDPEKVKLLDQYLAEDIFIHENKLPVACDKSNNKVTRNVTQKEALRQPTLDAHIETKRAPVATKPASYVSKPNKPSNTGTKINHVKEESDEEDPSQNSDYYNRKHGLGKWKKYYQHFKNQKSLKKYGKKEEESDEEPVHVEKKPKISNNFQKEKTTTYKKPEVYNKENILSTDVFKSARELDVIFYKLNHNLNQKIRVGIYLFHSC